MIHRDGGGGGWEKEQGWMDGCWESTRMTNELPRRQ